MTRNDPAAMIYLHLPNTIRFELSAVDWQIGRSKQDAEHPGPMWFSHYRNPYAYGPTGARLGAASGTVLWRCLLCPPEAFNVGPATPTASQKPKANRSTTPAHCRAQAELPYTTAHYWQDGPQGCSVTASPVLRLD